MSELPVIQFGEEDHLVGWTIHEGVYSDDSFDGNMRSVTKVIIKCVKNQALVNIECELPANILKEFSEKEVIDSCSRAALNYNPPPWPIIKFQRPVTAQLKENAQ